jgi:hypothetical protein
MTILNLRIVSGLIVYGAIEDFHKRTCTDCRDFISIVISMGGILLLYIL